MVNTTESESAGKAVGEPSAAYVSMAEDWRPIQDLLGGTRRMREVAIASDTWLPRFEKESPNAYASRVRGSFLHNFYADNVSKLAAKPFSKSLTVEEDALPEHLRPMIEDMDLDGTTLQAFAEESFCDAINFGLSHAIVDYTEIPENVEARQNGKAGDRVAELAIKPRPRAILVRPDAILGWRTRRGPQNETIISMIRIAETRVEPDGDFGEKVVSYVRVWTEAECQVWKKDADAGEEGEYIPEEAKPHTFGSIPLRTWYANRTGFMEAQPPLLDLAWVTIDHWQSYSDQRNILHVARVPILFRKGISKSNLAKEGAFVLGASRVISTSSDTADVRYVEPSGGAISAGKDHLESLERRADILGAEPMASRGPATATGEIRAESKATSWILSWIEAEERWLRSVFDAAAAWTPKAGELSDDFRVRIPKDFDLRASAGEEYGLIQKDHADGAITAGRRLAEGKRRGIYPEDFDPDAEAELALSAKPEIFAGEE